MKTFATYVLLGSFLSACASAPSHPHAAPRIIIATYDVWDGTGPPRNDPAFAQLGCAGLLTITNVDVTFAPQPSRGCSFPMHQTTRGTLAYREISEIRVTRRPEVLIFKSGTNPPALRVTDWIGGTDFQQAVAMLRSAYEISKTIGSGAP